MTLRAASFVAGFVLILASQIFSCHQQTLVLDHLEHVLESRTMDTQTITETWISGGRTVTVSTPQLADEDPDAHVKRHDLKVQALLKIRPVDPPA